MLTQPTSPIRPFCDRDLKQSGSCVRRVKPNQLGELAATPGLFVQIAQPIIPYLAVPRVSSVGRDYLPTSFYGPETIASDALLTIPGADEVLFGTISSRVFTAWNRTVSGRLKSDLRVSQEVTYNNYPWLATEDPNREAIAFAAEAVLDARASILSRPWRVYIAQSVCRDLSCLHIADSINWFFTLMD